MVIISVNNPLVTRSARHPHDNEPTTATVMIKSFLATKELSDDTIITFSFDNLGDILKMSEDLSAVYLGIKAEDKKAKLAKGFGEDQLRLDSE